MPGLGISLGISAGGGGGGGGIANPAPVDAAKTGAVAQLRSSLKGALTWSKLSGASTIAISAAGVLSLSGALGAGGSASAVVRVQNTSNDAVERSITIRAAAVTPAPAPAPTPAPTPTPTPSPTLSPYLGEVGTRTFLNTHTYSATNGKAMSRTPHYHQHNGPAPRPRWGNWYVDRGSAPYEFNGTGTLTIRASIEYPAGTFTALTFGGAATGTILPGEDIIADSPAGLTIPEGAMYWVRSFVTSSNGFIPYAGRDVATGLGCASAFGASVTDLTMGGTVVHDGQTRCFYPLGLVAITTKPSWAIYGDSRSVFPQTSTRGDAGEFAPSIGAAGFAYTNCGVPGDEAQNILSTFVGGGRKRLRQAQFASHVHILAGGNDINSVADQTGSNTLTRLGRLYDYFGGKVRSAATISPHANSTNTAVSSSTRNSRRQTINSGLRNRTVSNFEILVDTASVTEAGTSGIWADSSWVSDDGTHETDAGLLGIVASGVVPIAALLAATPSVVDNAPNAFAFTDQTGLAPSTLIESAAVVITGINADTAISITGGEYQIAGGAWTNAAGTIVNNQSVKVRGVTSANGNSTTNVVLTIGGVADTFSLTTAASSTTDTTPDAFAFVDQTNVVASTLIESAAITIAGIDAASPITVAGGEYQIAGGTWTSAEGTVTNGQTVKVRGTSSATAGGVTNVVLTVGGVSDTFTLTTAAPAGPAYLDTFTTDTAVTWDQHTSESGHKATKSSFASTGSISVGPTSGATYTNSNTSDYDSGFAPTSADYYVEAEHIRRSSVGTSNSFVARGDASTDGGIQVIYNDNTQVATLARRGTNAGTIATANAALPVGGKLTNRLEMRGDQLVWIVNGAVVGTYTESTYKSAGRLRLRISGGATTDTTGQGITKLSAGYL